MPTEMPTEIPTEMPTENPTEVSTTIKPICNTTTISEYLPSYGNPFLPEPNRPSRPKYCSRSYFLSHPIRLTSPNYPKEYLNDDNCLYFLHFDRSDICYISITFNRFSVGLSSDLCSGDYL